MRCCSRILFQLLFGLWWIGMRDSLGSCSINCCVFLTCYRFPISSFCGRTGYCFGWSLGRLWEQVTSSGYDKMDLALFRVDGNFLFQTPMNNFIPCFFSSYCDFWVLNLLPVVVSYFESYNRSFLQLVNLTNQLEQFLWCKLISFAVIILCLVWSCGLYWRLPYKNERSIFVA